MGGISFPLLADFEPKGGLAQQCGLYLESAGITDRATVIIRSDGVVSYVDSASPSGRRDIAALAAECAKIGGTPLAEAGSIPAGSTLYVDTGYHIMGI